MRTIPTLHCVRLQGSPSLRGVNNLYEVCLAMSYMISAELVHCTSRVGFKTDMLRHLSALQQIESAPCGATDREYSLHEVAVSGQYALAKGIDEISHEDHRILQQVFLDTYNFLNTVSTSRRCDKLSRRVESVRDDDTTATRRRLMQPPRPGPFQNFTFHFSTGVACWYCDNNTGLFGNDSGRRLMPGVKMENSEEHHSQSGRSLGGAVDEKTYKKCTCPVHAGKFGPVPRQEFVFAFDDAIQLLQKQGLLVSINGVFDVIEG